MYIVWGLMLSLVEIEVHGLVRQPEFFENDGDFPKDLNDVQMVTTFGRDGIRCTSRWVRHCGCTR